MDYLSFLRAKLDLFAAAGMDMRAPCGDGALAQMMASKRGIKTRARSLDSAIERFAGFNPDLAEARSELIRRFGIDRLGVAPADVARRVLARGTIRGDTEAAVVRDIVSNFYNEQIFGKEAFEQLAKILDQAGY